MVKEISNYKQKNASLSGSFGLWKCNNHYREKTSRHAGYVYFLQCSLPSFLYEAPKKAVYWMTNLWRFVTMFICTKYGWTLLRLLCLVIMITFSSCYTNALEKHVISKWHVQLSYLYCVSIRCVNSIQFSLFTQTIKWYMRSISIYCSKVKGTFINE